MPLLIVPRSDYTTAFRAFVGRVKSGTLAHAVRTWREWDGRAPADDPVSAGQCPWVRLTPDGGAARRVADEGDGTYFGEERLGILIETWVTGTNVDAAFDLWGVVKDAIFPQDAAARSALDAAWLEAGIADVTLDAPAVPNEYRDGLIGATGRVTLLLHLKQ